jgi:hypothetical protein
MARVEEYYSSSSVIEIHYAPNESSRTFVNLNVIKELIRIIAIPLNAKCTLKVED